MLHDLDYQTERARLVALCAMIMTVSMDIFLLGIPCTYRKYVLVGVRFLTTLLLSPLFFSAQIIDTCLQNQSLVLQKVRWKAPPIVFYQFDAFSSYICLQFLPGCMI
jgi:hypothetical protein